MPYEAKPPAGSSVTNLSTTEVPFGNAAGDGLESSADLTYNDSTDILTLGSAGTGATSGVIRVGDASPAYAFRNGTTTGIGLSGTTTLALFANNSIVATLNNVSGIILASGFALNGGSASGGNCTIRSTTNATKGTLITEGGFRRTVRTVTTTATVTDGDDIIFADAAGGAFDVTLPTAVGRTGQTFTVKCVSTNDVTVKSAGGTLDGTAAATGIVLTVQFSARTFTSDGTNWLITGAHL